MVKKKKNLGRIIIPAAVLVVLAAVYFLLLPTLAANSYTSTVKDKQPALRAEMQRVNELMDRDIFVNDEPTLSAIRADVKASQDVLADAKNQLNVAESGLTSYSQYPLTGWLPASIEAKKLNDLERTYVKEATSATDEMVAVIKYFDESADYVVEIRTMDMSDAIADATTTEEIVSSLNKFIKKLESIVDKLAALEAPDSLKKSHDYSVSSSKEMIKILKEMSTALAAEDYDKVNTLYAKMDKVYTDATKKLDQLFDEFVNESKLRTHIDKMLEADREIKALLK